MAKSPRKPRKLPKVFLTWLFLVLACLLAGLWLLRPSLSSGPRRSRGQGPAQTQAPIPPPKLHLAPGRTLSFRTSRPLVASWERSPLPRVLLPGHHLLPVPRGSSPWTLRLQAQGTTLVETIQFPKLLEAAGSRELASLVRESQVESLAGRSRRDTEEYLALPRPSPWRRVAGWIPEMLRVGDYPSRSRPLFEVWEDAQWEQALRDFLGQPSQIPSIPPGEPGWRGVDPRPWSSSEALSLELEVGRTRDFEALKRDGGIRLAIEAGSDSLGTLNKSFAGGAVSLKTTWPKLPESLDRVAVAFRVSALHPQHRIDLELPSGSFRPRLLRLWHPDLSQGNPTPTYTGWLSVVLPKELLPRPGSPLRIRLHPLAWPMIGKVWIWDVTLSWPTALALDPGPGSKG